MVVSVSVGSVKSQSAMGSQPQAINAFDLRYLPLISAAARRPGALGLPRSAQTKWLHTRANAIDAYRHTDQSITRVAPRAASRQPVSSPRRAATMPFSGRTRQQHHHWKRAG